MTPRLTNKHLRILEAAARYKFITYRQMKRLAIDRHISNLSNLVSDLSKGDHPYLLKIPHQPATEVKIYLTKKGKDLLVEHYDWEDRQVLFPKGNITTDTQDQKHRTSLISIQIELDLACEQDDIDLLFCDRYFDRVGNNRQDKSLKSKTAILYQDGQSIKADLVFKLQTPKQAELYLLELENGKDTAKGVDKCVRHAQAILKGSANQKYHFQSGYRTLWIFEYESTLLHVCERLKSVPIFDHLTEYFLFKPLKKVEENNFFEGWLNLAGELRKMFY